MTALWVVNFFFRGIKGGTCAVWSVYDEKGSANSVPAAAVIRRMRALSVFLGFKEGADGV